MTEQPDNATAESSPRADEPACAGAPPASADSEKLPLADATSAVVAEKTMTWNNPIRVGDCTMDPGLNVKADGNAYLFATITSSSDDDAWVIRGGISLMDGNGTVLFTSGKLVSPTCPQSPAATTWYGHFTYPAIFFGSINSARINRAHC